MAKAASRKGPGSGSKSKGQKPSNWSLWAVAVGLVAVIAWSSLRQEVRKGKPKSAVAATEPDKDDDTLSAVREAFFGEGGALKQDRENKRARFSEAEYWEQRYSKQKQEHYDWYGTWDGDSNIKIKPHVFPSMPGKVQTILNVGCGNSRLAEELANDGFRDIVSVDIAQAAIDRMTQKFKGIPSLRFMQMDATKMTFPDSSFDVVFDKGTLDAMYTGASELVKLAVAEIFRVLRPGGLFVSLTFGPPKARKDLNSTSGVDGKPPGWQQFQTKKLTKDDGAILEKQPFWMYLMTKPA